MNTLFIIAAGNGTRLGLDIPKALVPFHGRHFIFDTLDKVKYEYAKIYIVINKNHFGDWCGLKFPPNVEMLAIESGRGDGHAVREALRILPKIPYDITIMWGDVFLRDPEIIDELLEQDLSHGLVPCEYVSNPYVCIKTDMKNNITHALFSKYGEHDILGYHDLSIFRFCGPLLYKVLNALHRSYDRGGIYMTPGKELSTLFAFHYMHNKGVPAKAYTSSYRTQSFNTMEELKEIHV